MYIKLGQMKRFLLKLPIIIMHLLKVVKNKTNLQSVMFYA